MSAPVRLRLDPRRARRLCYRVAMQLRRWGQFDAARGAIHSARRVTRSDLIRCMGGAA
jgi:hypothetical protein